MRTLTAPAAAEAAKVEGAEPITIIKIAWGGATGDKYYADRAVTVGTITAAGRIYDCNLSSLGIINQPGSVQTVDINLADSDQGLRALTNSIDMEGLAVTIYQHFGGLAEADLVVLLSGVVRGPPVWSDSDRTLAFQVEQILKDAELTFTPEAGEVSGLPAESEGKTWPLVFGTAIDVPAVLTSRGASGTLQTGIHRFTTQFIVTDGSSFPQLQTVDILVDRMLLRGVFNGDLFQIHEANVARFENVNPAPRVAGDPDFRNSSVFWLQDATQELVGLTLQVKDDPISMRQARKTNICVAQEGDKCWFRSPWGVVISNTTPGAFVAAAVARAQGLLDNWLIKAGTRVRQAGTPDVYVANDSASTSVLRVQAAQEQTDADGVAVRSLVPVPSNFYTANVSDTVGGRTVTTVTFTTPLQDRDPAWRADEIYVTVESIQSSNTATAIKFLLEDRGGFAAGEIDATSFTSVAALMLKYPSHFALLAPTRLPDLADLADQARGHLAWASGKWTIRYLSSQPVDGDQAATLDDTNVNVGGVVITHSDREGGDLFATRLVGIYQDNYAQIPKRIVLQNTAAIAKYGTLEAVVQFWGYQTAAMVTKSLTFMLNRRSRVWKEASIETQINALAVEVLDLVKLDMTDLFPAALIGRALELGHNTETHEILAGMWLPIEAGTNSESAAAYLDDTGDTAPADPGADITAGDPEALRVAFRNYLQERQDAQEQDGVQVPGKILSKATLPDYNVQLFPEGLDAAAGDEVVARALDGAEPSAGDEVMCSRVNGEWNFQFAGSSGGSQYRVKSVGQDAVTCRTFDGVVEGTDDVVIAKPYLLRLTPFHTKSRGGITYSYTSNTERVGTDDVSSDTETQVVVPSYVLDDIIYAIKGIGGGTGVSGATLVDINADARAWAKKDGT